MKVNKRLIFILIGNCLLFACSLKPVEKYYDYFYSNVGDSANSFTYILYLGEKGSHRPEAKDEHSSNIPQRQRGEEIRSRKADDDDFMSLSFRMEEEAFKRLEEMLADNGLCKNKVEYDLSEYSWLRYTIKGHCSNLSQLAN